MRIKKVFTYVAQMIDETLFNWVDLSESSVGDLQVSLLSRDDTNVLAENIKYSHLKSIHIRMVARADRYGFVHPDERGFILERSPYVS